MTRAWSSHVPWEKLRRATSMPASISCWISSGAEDAGPMVQTIFVRRMLTRLLLETANERNWQCAEKLSLAQAAQKGPDARRQARRGARRTWSVRRSAARARQRSRWAFFSSLLDAHIRFDRKLRAGNRHPTNVRISVVALEFLQRTICVRLRLRLGHFLWQALDSVPGQHPSIHVEDLARHIVRGPGGQENDGAHEVLSRPGPTPRDHRRDTARPRLVPEQIVVEGRPVPARADGVHIDPERGQLQGQLPGEQLEPALARR